jgi:hypothetical protein
VASAAATSAEGDQASAPPAAEQPPTPLLPTHLEPSSGPLPPEHTPEEVVGVLNGLVAQGAIDQEEFSKLYLRELGPLGGTEEDADRHWEALQEELQAERTAAEELAARMRAEAAEPPGIRPWNPLEDPEAARAEAEQLRHLFNTMVQALRKERNEAGSALQAPGYLKDKIAKSLSQRSGLSYRTRTPWSTSGLAHLPAFDCATPGRPVRIWRGPPDGERRLLEGPAVEDRAGGPTPRGSRAS